MKNLLLRSALVALTIFICTETKAQFHFGVSPGLQLNGAVFGYKVKKFVPYIGLQVMSGSMNYTQKGKKYDSNIGEVVDYDNKVKVSGTVYMPSIGFKYFFAETNKLKAYGNICFTKFLLSAKVVDSEDPAASESLDKALKNISVYGAQLGFGMEYFFDDNFSIGGEFGLRLAHLKFKDDFNEDVYNPNTGNDEPTNTTATTILNFNPTYSKLALNFYFGK